MDKKWIWVLVGVVVIGVITLFSYQNKKEVLMEENTNTVGSESGTSRQQVVLHTEKGDITIELLPEIAPNHVENFLKLARSNFYDGTRFHRVIAGFMIQGGDPLTKDESRRPFWGTGGPGYTINAEFNTEPHVRGVVSMARAQDPNSAGSQFFIVVADSTFLDRQYTVFGRVISGMEVADAIVTSGAGKELPDNPVVITKAELR